MKRILIVCMILMLSACENQPDLIDCHGNPDVGGICIDVTAPTFTGVENTSVAYGASFGPMIGVFATDETDGDLTQEITYVGAVDTQSYGTYLLRYSVTDTSGNEAIALRYVTVLYVPDPQQANNLVVNGDFENGMYGFSTTTGLAGGLATFLVSDGILAVTVTNIAPGTPWEPRLEYQSLHFEQGRTYYVSFDIRADEPRFIQSYIGELIPSDPWFLNYNPGESGTYEVDSGFTTYSFTFTMNSTTTDNGCILFHFGEIGSGGLLTTVYLDNIVIQQVEE